MRLVCAVLRVRMSSLDLNFSILKHHNSCILSLQMTLEPTEEDISVAWKAVEQLYRFGIGSIAGGNQSDPRFFLQGTLK